MMDVALYSSKIIALVWYATIVKQINAICDTTKPTNLLDDDGTLGGTNETESGDSGTGRLSLDGEVGTRTVDLALSEFLAKQLKTTSVLDTDLGLVGMLLDGEGLKALAVAVAHSHNGATKIIVVFDWDATASLVVAERNGALVAVIESIGCGHGSRTDLQLRRNGRNGEGGEDGESVGRVLHG